MNLIDELDPSELAGIVSQCSTQLQIDEKSRKEWLDVYHEAMKLALQEAERKNYPFEQAANVVYPLLTTASVQFAARAYPGLFPSRNIVKARIVGDDSGKYLPRQTAEGVELQEVVPPGEKASRAQRVSRFASFALKEWDEDWEADTDALLHNLPIAGCAFRKRWWNNGPKSKFITAENLVVNNAAKSLDTAPQVSERIFLYPHEIQQRVASGYYNEEAAKQYYETQDSGEPYEIIEAHCRYDIDGDGYDEPYIVTFVRGDERALRVAENIGEPIMEGGEVTGFKPRAYYVKFPFIPNPSGGFYDIGFGTLLAPINKSVNASINQLLDAAHWQNAPSGFIGRRLHLKAGDMRMRPGEYKLVNVMGDDLRKEIYHMQFPGPSPVTFNLLSLMINAGQDISSVKDIMLGDSEKNLAPTTALTLVEQGTKQFTAIYKRIHRALKREMKLLFDQMRENSAEIEQVYLATLDDDQANVSDFDDDYALVPVTDPDMVSDQVAMAKAQFLEELAAQGRVDPAESLKRTLEAANIEDPEALIPKQQEPDPEILIKMAKLENEKARIENDTKRAHAEILEQHTQAMKNLADAEAAEDGVQIERYKAEVDAITRTLNELGRIQQVEGQRRDAASVRGVSPTGGARTASNGAGSAQPSGGGGL